MAIFDAEIERAVAIELKERITELYADILPIFMVVGNWKLSWFDSDLPGPFDVRVQLDAYKALKLEPLRLTAWDTQFQQAAVGDTLSYLPPPTDLIVFDDRLIFSEQLIF